MKFERSAGVLLPPTSLPGKYGIGDLGDDAFKFVDFLKEAGVEVYGPVDFKWIKAKAYYFYDPDGNLIEYWSPGN